MNNGLILIAVLLIVLIYFVMQIPRKHTNHKSEVVYVNRQYPVWNIPTGLARPLRRSGDGVLDLEGVMVRVAIVDFISKNILIYYK